MNHSDLDGHTTMAALIGLFAGAWIGYLLLAGLGAAICGIAGFFAGAKFSAWRKAAAAITVAVAAVRSARATGRRAARRRPRKRSSCACRGARAAVAILERAARATRKPWDTRSARTHVAVPDAA
jgi:hypothetical protein